MKSSGNCQRPTNCRGNSCKQVQNMLAPKYVNPISKDSENSATNRIFCEKLQKDPKQTKKLWDQLDVTGSDSWTENQKSDIKPVSEDYNDVFAQNPLELGRTSLVKHTIKVIDP